MFLALAVDLCQVKINRVICYVAVNTENVNNSCDFGNKNINLLYYSKAVDT